MAVEGAVGVQRDILWKEHREEVVYKVEWQVVMLVTAPMQVCRAHTTFSLATCITTCPSHTLHLSTPLLGAPYSSIAALRHPSCPSPPPFSSLPGNQSSH